MLLTVGLMLFLGLLVIPICQKLRLPNLIGYLLIGIIIGPYCLNLISEQMIIIGPDIKKMALIIILIRAGLTLDISDLRHVGKSAILMCFVPATVEIIASAIFAPILLGISVYDALLIGAIIAAVSPAVVVPRMIEMIENKVGTQHHIPQLILAGSSADDIYVLIIFSALLAMPSNGNMNIFSFLAVPVSMGLGVISGIIIGKLLLKILRNYSMKTIYGVSLILAISMGLMVVESLCDGWFSGLIAIIIMTMLLAKELPEIIEPYKSQYNQLWVLAEMFLFMLVGMSMNVVTSLDFGILPIIFIIVTSLFRMFGVYLSLIPSELTQSEKIFTMGAYLPKATVQAAIGGIPLAMGLPNGELILTISVLEILLTAPIGAIWIDRTQKKFLVKK